MGKASGCSAGGEDYDPRRSKIVRLEEDMSVQTPSEKEAIPAAETIEVDTTRVKCDGGGGALGHPLVYLEMGDETFVECGYCDRRFVLKPGAERH